MPGEELMKGLAEVAAGAALMPTCACGELHEADCALPHVVEGAEVQQDGAAFCALVGPDLQEGVAGFGDTPREACEAFDRAWREASDG